jgi:RNA polymerase sigma-70 factor (ECF subfamily)
MPEFDSRTAFTQHSATIHRFVWRMTNSASAAEDITQEIFLLLLRRPGCFKADRGQLLPFLIGVARNLARKWLAQEGRYNNLEDEEFIAEVAEVEDRETSEIVGAAVSSLPPLQREVLILAHYEGLSLHEIAQIANTEVGTIKSRLHRARQNLRCMLAPLDSRRKGLTANGTTRR